MKSIKILFLLFILSNFVYSQQFRDPLSKIPFDTTFVRGVLPNGLSYYIKYNNSPKGRASYYLIQNVGASLENDQQNGLAHFLEHMAFNGTKSFPGKGLVNMLEKRGVKFGKDINAYTTRNETVYNLSKVPSNDLNLVDSCLLILHDWCDDLSLEDSEIDAERGVISEEWRSRRNGSFRIREQLAPTLYNGSIYAQRDVIGNLNVIKTFEHSLLRSFYHDWYRTDLQCIAIVGDLDIKETERKVIPLFSEIPAIENPKKRPFTVIPDNDSPMYKLATDPEYKYVTTSYKVRFENRPLNTIDERREKFLVSFFNYLTKGRISEILKKGDAPFLNASINIGLMERAYSSFNFEASSYPGNETKAFQAIYEELQRIIRFGFTNTEMERMKISMLNAEENRFNKRKNIDSDDICKQIKNSYLESTSIPSPEFVWDFAKEIIPGIRSEEVSALASRYLNGKNVNYMVTGPEASAVPFISQVEIEAIIEQVKSMELTPYVDDVPENPTLLGEQPVPGEIILEKDIDQFKAHEWILSNGAKVVYKYVKSPNIPIVFKAVSPGGNSLYAASDLPSVDAITGIVPRFGLGDYDPVQLKKILAGNTAGSEFKIGEFTEEISANALPKDIETMFQMVYMRFEQPKFDEEVFTNLMKRFYYNAENTAKTPQSIIKDTLNSILNQGNPRYERFDKKYLNKIDFEKMQSIYHARFSNAADYVFYIVGDVKPDVLKPLVEKYIASIPGTEYVEKWKDNGNFFPKGKIVKNIYIPMQDKKATVNIKMKANMEYAAKSTVYNTILCSVLTIRYLDEIREKEGGTYGVTVKPTMSRLLHPSLGIEVRFDCDPDKADHLKSLVYKELNLAQKKIDQTDLDKVVFNMKKNFQQMTRNNKYWMTVLNSYYEFGDDMTSPAYYSDILEQVTVKDIRNAAKKFMKHADILDITFLPKE